jgi:hypothetical protein
MFVFHFKACNLAIVSPIFFYFAFKCTIYYRAIACAITLFNNANHTIHASHLLANDLDKRSDFKNGYGNWPIRILDIRASSRYEAGYAIGKLTAKEALQNIHNFLARMIPFDVRLLHN